MHRATLLDFFDDIIRISAPFLVYDDGYRPRSHGYAEVGSAARAFANRLDAQGIGTNDKVLFWSENRPEWIVALWGCLLQGAIAVPIDYRASADLLRRVQRIVGARLLLMGTDVNLPPSDPGEDEIATWSLDEIEWPPAEGETRTGRPAGPRADVQRDHLAEILFTSGTTGDPKGVTITHRNILANITPVEREIAKYRRYARPFLPLRFLNVLPLSHLFGQAMATFIPPMLPGTVVFMRGFNPNEIVRQIKSRRVAVLVCVPKMLDVLRTHVSRLVPEAAEPPGPNRHWVLRWWRYRRVHRLFGWRFCALVVGAAPLDPDLEAFWTRLGFVVVQGYGLTETAPIVTLNHPFQTRRGTVGKPIAGVEVKLAPDGEILVRGENVTAGYYGAEAETVAAFEDGWFRTGDIGAFDETGQLTIRGRKKEMIVTPEGLNVFPEDVERVLNELPGVRDSAVVGLTDNGQERPHAVLVLDEGIEPDEVLRQANARLEAHQRVRAAAVWPQRELPRTEGTRKLKRRELRQWIAGERRPGDAAAGAEERDMAEVVGAFAKGRTVTPETRLEALGLSSLERVELLMALEERFQATIDEASFAAAETVQDLEKLVQPHATLQAPPPAKIEAIEFPRWNRRAAARAVRRVSLPTWILPIARIFAWVRVEGLEHLERLREPVVFAANHQSHLDTPVILAALPSRWRYRLAPAMAKEFFRAHFHPAEHTRRQWLTNSLNYCLAALFFNAFPLPQREAGTRQTLRYMGELISDGCSILIFPEGVRSETSAIGPFQAGVGMVASRLAVPVVPVRLEGVDRVLHPKWRMARPGPVRVAFGPAIRLKGEDFAGHAREIESAVRRL
jgi:long-chain acyl-CoA synthetase